MCFLKFNSIKFKLKKEKEKITKYLLFFYLQIEALLKDQDNNAFLLLGKTNHIL